MNCSPIRKELIKKKLTDLQDEVSSLKQDFRNNRKSVDEYCHSRFHDELSTLRGKKRNIHNLILGVLAANIQSREPSRRYLSELKPLLRQLNAVEADFQALLTSLNTKDPLEHADSAIKAIENDLETNFCLLRRIKCNLPYRQNWMQFLTSLTQKNREAAFNYYKAAFKDVRQCGRCISSVHRLLALLSKGKSGNEETMLTIQHLTISNSACEALCYDIWLHLLEMIIFLERFKPQKIIDKSTISTFHYQGNWPKELPNGSKRVWNLADDDESLTKRRRAQLWYSCLNDRILLEKLENKDQLSGGGSSRHVTFENGQDLLQSTGNKLKSPVPADTGGNVHSPASISHSEARKLISEMSTGSDIIRTPSPELTHHRTVIGSSDSNDRRLNSYLAAAEAAEMFVAQLHSNSNVEISTSVLRKSCSDDHLLKAAMDRTRSLDDLNGPHTDKAISLSHSLDDTTTCPFDASEHLMSAWDNYQVPYYSSIEAIEPSEPKAKFPEALFWEDLFPDETEALDFEQQLHQTKGTTRQIDEWSFEGLSSTPFSSLEGVEMIEINDGRSESSEALLEPGDRDPFSEEYSVSVPHSIEKRDKCIQTEAEESVNGALTPSAFLSNSQSVIAHDTNTTHTSGYESGPDAINSLFQRSHLCSLNNSEEVDGKKSAPPTSRDFGVQAVRSDHHSATYSIMEESPDYGLLFEGVESNLINQSEQDMLNLRAFLLEILASSNNDNNSSPSSATGKKQRRTKCSDAFNGPRSVYNLMKCFSCMRKSAERNSKMLQSSEVVDIKHREELSDRWNVLTRWIDNHTEELQEFNNFQEKLQELSLKANVLKQVADKLSDQNSPKRSQTLANESGALVEDAENLRELILNRKLQTRNKTRINSLDSPELSDLDELYSECRNKFLDRTMQDIRYLTNQTKSLKSTFSYLESLNDRLQISPEIETNTFLNETKAETNQSNHLLFNKRSVHSRVRFITQIQFAFFAIFVFITLLYVCDGIERYFPFRCMRNEWPGCRALHFYQIGVPPQ